VVAGSARDGVRAECDHGYAVVALAAVYDHPAGQRAHRREPALDVRGCDHLAGGGLEEIPLAVGDTEESIGVDLTDVTGS
jgi:hypothetical protein